MGGFFKGWRRKAGIAVLVVAFALAGAWLHCVQGYVAAKIEVNDRVFVVMSYASRFECVTFDLLEDPVGASPAHRFWRAGRLIAIYTI